MKPVTTDDVIDLMDAHFASSALGVALESGLFWLLESQPLNAVGVAEALSIPKNRCQYLLQLLTNVGLLERIDDAFAPSQTTRSAILNEYSQEAWAMLAELARQRYPVLRDLPVHIHESGSVWTALGLRPPNFQSETAKDADTARRFTRMLYEFHQPFADILASALNMNGVNRLMDIGGGSGVISMSLLRRYPQLTAVVVDIANVCAVGQKVANEDGLGDRIHYRPTNFLENDLPSGFDMVLECDVGIYSEALFLKVWTALNSGGRFVIVDKLAPTKCVAPDSREHWAFLRSLSDPEFTYFTSAEIKGQLEELGFQFLSQRVLSSSPRATERFTAGFTLMEFCKRV